MNPIEPSNGSPIPSVPRPDRPRTLLSGRGDPFLSRVKGETGANISSRYQCERCTNACPVSQNMDHSHLLFS